MKSDFMEKEKKASKRKHDSFFKYIYSIPQNTKALLQLAQRRTPALRKMLSNVNMESLEPIPGSFSTVGERGEADLAFKAKSLKGGPDAFVGILLEHKSVRENDTLSQIYHYVFEVMVNKSNSDFKWLPTKAIIIYNGKSHWNPVEEFKKKGYEQFNGKDLPFECVMVSLANILDSDCSGSNNPVAAIGLLVMKHAYDPDGLKSAGKIIKELLDKLDNNARATLVKKIELYLKWYVDKTLIKEMIMAFRSIGERMGFVSIADAERKAKAAGLRKGMKKGLEEGLKKGIEEGIEKGIKKGIEKSRKNSEKMFKLWVQRVSKKLNVPEKDLLALKP